MFIIVRYFAGICIYPWTLVGSAIETILENIWKLFNN